MSELPATSIFWRLAGNSRPQLLVGADLVSCKKLHASTPTRISLLAGNSLRESRQVKSAVLLAMRSEHHRKAYPLYTARCQAVYSGYAFSRCLKRSVPRFFQSDARLCTTGTLFLDVKVSSLV